MCVEERGAYYGQAPRPAHTARKPGQMLVKFEQKKRDGALVTFLVCVSVMAILP